MKLGLQIPRWQWAGGAAACGPTLARIAQAAEAAGYDSLWLMDHLFQIRSIGNVEEEMFEAYTTLGFVAAHTRRVRLGTLVTAATYRQPGLLIKQVTTLDVLSGGRAWLGIGAGWYEREARGLGLFFPPRAERFERLEDTLRLAHHMWRGDRSPFIGRHVVANEPLNMPLPLSQPRPPILIGGGGEQKTLRLVARYADACNLFARLGSAELARKLEVLRAHCAAEGRDYQTLDKTVLTSWDPLRKRSQIVDQLGELHRLGFETVIASLREVHTIEPIQAVARDILPEAARL
jgi:F420-dependent oxidoreductase-like protein